MIRVVDWLKDEKIEDELFAFTSMHDLVITDRKEFDWDHHTLCVSLDFPTRKLHFEYARHWASTDRMKKIAEESEAIEVLRQFLAYKFGVHRPPRTEPNQALQHNDPSCHVSCLRTPRASRGRG
jgi:hypothetical protein